VVPFFCRRICTQLILIIGDGIETEIREVRGGVNDYWCKRFDSNNEHEGKYDNRYLYLEQYCSRNAFRREGRRGKLIPSSVRLAYKPSADEDESCRDSPDEAEGSRLGNDGVTDTKP
jgi:hypothetical protein